MSLKVPSAVRRQEFATWLLGTCSSAVPGSRAPGHISTRHSTGHRDHAKAARGRQRAPVCAVEVSLLSHTGSSRLPQTPYSLSLGTMNPQIRLVETISVPLSSSPFILHKATPQLPLATADSGGPDSHSPPVPLLVSDQNISSELFKVGLSCFLFAKCSLDLSSLLKDMPEQMSEKVSQPSFTQSSFLLLEYGFFSEPIFHSICPPTPA